MVVCYYADRGEYMGNLLVIAYELVEKQIMRRKGDEEVLGIFKHSIESRFIAGLIMDTCVLWLVLTFAFRNRNLSLIEDFCIQAVAVFIALAYSMLGKGKLRIGKVNKKAFWEVELKFFKYAVVICIFQCILTWLFKYNVTYVNLVKDVGVRWTTYILSVLIVYGVCWSMPHVLHNMKNAPVRFCVTKPCAGKFNKYDIAYIAPSDSLFIVEHNGRIRVADYEEEGYQLSYCLGVVGDDCLVRVYGFRDITNVYDCKCVIVKLLSSGYRKWYYDKQLKDWVSVPYKVTKEEKKGMKDAMKERDRRIERLSNIKFK